MDVEEKKLLKRLERARETKKLDDWELYCRRLAEYRASLGKYESALAAYKEELSVCEIKGDADGIANAHRMMGEMLSALGQFQESLDYVNKYLSYARKSKNTVEEQRALATMGRTYFCWAAELRSNEFSAEDQIKAGEILKECRKAYKKSLYICEEELKTIGHRERQEMKARILFNLGLACEIEGELSAALSYVTQAITICKQELLLEDLHRCYISQCTMNLKKGETHAAISSADLAMEVAKKLSNSTELTVLSLLHKSEVYFTMGNYISAKKYLKIAYKMKTPILEDKEAVELALKRAILLCDLETKLADTNEDALAERKALFEKLGDACCSVKNYKHAIQSYLNMLKCALSLGCSGKDLQPCYVSLYQTYKDDKKYDLALEHARKESEISKDVPAEAAKSHIAIGEILEAKGAPYFEISEEYLTARRLAAESGEVGVQASALRHLSAIQRADGREELAKETDKDLQCLPYTDSEEVGSEEDDVTPLSAIHLSDLSESDEEFARPRQVRNTFRITRNEKGETPLHVAAIRGDVSRAERLLSLGHPVKERDLAGWTPLHEAANHGHEAMVSTLIKAGADVNDPGGRDCGGITPLHDAASCGHFGVIKTLLENNASVTVLTDSGETPLECLKAWRERVDNLRESEEATYNELVKELSSRLSREGYDPSKKPSLKNVLKEKKNRSSSEETSRKPTLNLRREVDKTRVDKGWDRVSPERLRRSLSPDLSSPEVIRVPNSPKSKPEAPVVHYRSAMDALRKRPVPVEHRHHTSSKGPLLDETSYIEEWLEDDLKINKAPKKKRKCDNVVDPVPKRSSEENFPDFFFPLDDPSDFPVREEHSRKKAKTQTTLTESGFTSTPIPLPSEQLTDSPDIHMDFPSLPSPPFSSASDHAITKVRINVGRLILLVPIDSGKVEELTVRWLAEEVARRYYEIEGARPHLQLKTKDGAILAVTDPVSIALGEDLESTVTGWQTDSLTNRYTNAVNQEDRKPISSYGAYKGGVDQAVVERLAACDSSRYLDLSYMSLTSAELIPVLRALKHERGLRMLNLSGNVLGDTGLDTLVYSLEHCSVEEINLRCNNITAAGFTHFVDGLEALSGEFTTSLRKLDVSFNPIGSSIQGNQNKINTLLPNLTSFKTDHCESFLS